VILRRPAPTSSFSMTVAESRNSHAYAAAKSARPTSLN
jgi:hypothetical protein